MQQLIGMKGLWDVYEVEMGGGRGSDGEWVEPAFMGVSVDEENQNLWIGNQY